MRPRGSSIAAFGLVALGLVACGASSGPRPEPSLRRYVEALRRRDAAGVRAVQSRGARAQASLAALARGFRDNPAEVADEVQALGRSVGRPLDAAARVTLESGHVVSLVLEDDGWHVDGGVLGEPVSRSPLDAVRSLRSALRLRSLAAFQRILARRARAQLDERIRTLVEALDDDGTLQVRQEGESATVRFDGGLLTLVREAGEWRVVEIRTD